MKRIPVPFLCVLSFKTLGKEKKRSDPNKRYNYNSTNVQKNVRATWTNGHHPLPRPPEIGFVNVIRKLFLSASYHVFMRMCTKAAPLHMWFQLPANKANCVPESGSWS